jgi:hypothetical protein
MQPRFARLNKLRTQRSLLSVRHYDNIVYDYYFIECTNFKLHCSDLFESDTQTTLSDCNAICGYS